MAQGFTQRPGIDYDETYSLVMSGITFRYLISMVANLNLKMQLMDVVTAYLYGSLDLEISMKVPKGLKIPDIAFAVNLLARYSSTPTRRHWVGVKIILRYLQGTQDLGLWYSRKGVPSMMGYVKILQICWLYV